MEKIKITPKFFFITLGTLIALITSVISFMNLSGGLIDKTFVDVLSDSYQYGYYDYQYSSIRGALATLIIFFPIYLILERKWSKISKGEQSIWDSITRRWALYLVIFLATLTLVINLSMLVRYFVGGELTTRFILKTLSSILVVGVAGYYYIRELNNAKNGKNIFAIVSAILFLAIVFFGFSVIGLPKDQRLLKLDQKRRDDLNSLNYDIVSYWQQTKKLPDNFSDLNVLYSGMRNIKDPEFGLGKVYEYNILSEENLTYELCAEFSKPMPRGWVNGSSSTPYMGLMERDTAVYMNNSDMNWEHEAGRQCFERKINTNFVKPL